jgi:hypothetical protein
MGPNAQELLLFPLRDVKLVQRRDEVADQRIKLLIGDGHTGVGWFHVASGVGARAARRGANLFDQHGFQVRDIRIGKFAINATVIRDSPNKIVDHRRNCSFFPSRS